MPSCDLGVQWAQKLCSAQFLLATLWRYLFCSFLLPYLFVADSVVINFNNKHTHITSVGCNSVTKKWGLRGKKWRPLVVLLYFLYSQGNELFALGKQPILLTARHVYFSVLSLSLSFFFLESLAIANVYLMHYTHCIALLFLFSLFCCCCCHLHNAIHLSFLSIFGWMSLMVFNKI